MFSVNLDHSASNNLLKKLSDVFCCKGWGIKSKFCEPLMADVSHYFYSSHAWGDCCTQEQRSEIKGIRE